jgi:hypothetical protein
MPIPTFAIGRDEILQHFTAAWNAGTPPIPVLLYDDNHRDLPDDAPYARITIKHVTSSQVTLGRGDLTRFRTFGIVTVQVFEISGDGMASADTLVDLALNAFEGERTGLDRIYFRNARVNEIGQDGPWFQTNVIAEFEYDKLATPTDVFISSFEEAFT